MNRSGKDVFDWTNSLKYLTNKRSSSSDKRRLKRSLGVVLRFSCWLEQDYRDVGVRGMSLYVEDKRCQGVS